jgi:hypothetical protein
VQHLDANVDANAAFKITLLPAYTSRKAATIPVLESCLINSCTLHVNHEGLSAALSLAFDNETSHQSSLCHRMAILLLLLSTGYLNVL